MSDFLFDIIKNSDNPLETARKIVAPLCKTKLNEHIMNCKDCAIYQNTNKMLAKGNPDANILIIADNATNDTEVNDFFQELLDYSDIDQSDIFIINSVNCVCKRRDKENDWVERMPSSEEAKNCKYFIDYAIQFVKPRIIVSMGATALNQYMPNTILMQNIDKIFYFNGIPALITYSSNDLFSLSSFDEDEIDDLTDITINALNKAQQYINNMKK